MVSAQKVTWCSTLPAIFNGTATNGGHVNSCNCGVVFKLSPQAGGGWQETVLYAFTDSTDGGYPVSGLIFDNAGNLYGTAAGGGKLSACGGSGCGVVFKLTPGVSGWSESVIYTFSGPDGEGLQGDLVFDGAGNLYGITYGGGNNGCNKLGCGVAYELTPTTSGPWTQTLMHVFSGGTDGAVPFAGLTLDAAGNAYGTASRGGILSDCTSSPACGVAFELSPQTGGTWTETVLHRFTNGKDGGLPTGLLIFDAAGNLYGTAFDSGAAPNCKNTSYGCGAVFELQKTSGGGWKLITIFAFNGGDGLNPQGNLTFDAAGNLYGATKFGGGKLEAGNVFELTPHSGSAWTETDLFDFNGTDGSSPSSGLIFDTAGNLYGATLYAGSDATGNVYELSPAP